MKAILILFCTLLRLYLAFARLKLKPIRSDGSHYSLPIVASLHEKFENSYTNSIEIETKATFELSNLLGPEQDLQRLVKHFADIYNRERDSCCDILGRRITQIIAYAETSPKSLLLEGMIKPTSSYFEITFVCGSSEYCIDPDLFEEIDGSQVGCSLTKEEYTSLLSYELSATSVDTSVRRVALQSFSSGDCDFCPPKSYCIVSDDGGLGFFPHKTDEDLFFKCLCKEGYNGNGWHCEDIDECVEDWPCPLKEDGGYCVDTDPTNTQYPQYKCGCRSGFVATSSNKHGATECTTIEPREIRFADLFLNVKGSRPIDVIREAPILELASKETYQKLDPNACFCRNLLEVRLDGVLSEGEFFNATDFVDERFLQQESDLFNTTNSTGSGVFQFDLSLYFSYVFSCFFCPEIFFASNDASRRLMRGRILNDDGFEPVQTSDFASEVVVSFREKNINSFDLDSVTVSIETPSFAPSSPPSEVPSFIPSEFPTRVPSVNPTGMPSTAPTANPSISPTMSTGIPESSNPSEVPSLSALPSNDPSISPSLSTFPSSDPSLTPSLSEKPSSSPSDVPSLSMFPSSNPRLRNWKRLGSDISFGATSDYEKFSVSLSSDGTRLAIGAIAKTNNKSNVLRIYKWDESAWTQLGDNILVDSVFRRSWTDNSVSLSSDGTTVAIGMNSGALAGKTRIYRLNNNSWEQRGGDIDGEDSFDGSGYSVSLSSNGNRVAIGARFNNGNGLGNSGHTRIYDLDGNVWKKLGDDIDGEAANDQSGHSVSLSSNGKIVAIGARFNNGNGLGNSGHTRIYEWDGNVWKQLGGDIDGEAVHDESGYSVSLSSNGNRVAIGARFNDGNPHNSGHTRIYEWDGSSWKQLGGDIDGEASSDWSGYSVSLSSNGNRVAIGATNNDGNDSSFGHNSGHTRIYEWDESSPNWVQIGGDIDGEAAGEESGSSVSLSDDGNRVAIATKNGPIRVYEL